MGFSTFLQLRGEVAGRSRSRCTLSAIIAHPAPTWNTRSSSPPVPHLKRVRRRPRRRGAAGVLPLHHETPQCRATAGAVPAPAHRNTTCRGVPPRRPGRRNGP
jgi:hypothetical protein